MSLDACDSYGAGLSRVFMRGQLTLTAPCRVSLVLSWSVCNDGPPPSNVRDR